jgi:hypothetical protein
MDVRLVSPKAVPLDAPRVWPLDALKVWPMAAPTVGTPDAHLVLPMAVTPDVRWV